MEAKEYTTIKTTMKTKLRFDQFKLDLRKKGVKRDQDELVNMMINISMEQIKLKCKTIGDLRKLTEEYKK